MSWLDRHNEWKKLPKGAGWIDAKWTHQYVRTLGYMFPDWFKKSKITLKEAACNIPAIHLRLINPFEYIRIDFISEEIETTSGVVAIFIVVVVVVFVLVLVTVLIRVIGLVFVLPSIFVTKIGNIQELKILWITPLQATILISSWSPIWGGGNNDDVAVLYAIFSDQSSLMPKRFFLLNRSTLFPCTTTTVQQRSLR